MNILIQSAVSTLLCLSAVLALAKETISIQVVHGDQIGTVAQRYLMKPATNHWREIAALNKLSPPYTLRPGDRLLLPSRLLATQPAAAVWLAVTGDVRVKRLNLEVSAAQVGEMLKEQETVFVGAGSSATLQLSDGSQIKLLAGSQLVMDEHRYYLGRQEGKLIGTKAFSGLMRLIQGRIEAKAVSATDRAKPLRIQTPTSVVGVRGTEFRVSHFAQQEGETALTRSEVLEGAVAAELDAARTANLPAGFGVKLDPSVMGPLKAVELLEAPDLAGWKLFQDRPSLQLAALPSRLEAKSVSAYRIQVAPIEARLSTEVVDSATRDSFDRVVLDETFKPLEPVAIPGLQDGAWRFRVRGIDADGLEGKNAHATVVLKARPLPPILQSPQPAEKIVQTEAVHLVWSTVTGASGYLLEVVSSKGVRTEYALTYANALVRQLAPDTYTWRVATQALGRGPWSDLQVFTVVPLPESPRADFDAQQRTLVLRWADQKAARYELQLAREATFIPSLGQFVQMQTTEPSLMVSGLVAGTHYVRYRAIESSGFVGGWSTVMMIDVPVNWQHLLLYLGGGKSTWP